MATATLPTPTDAELEAARAQAMAAEKAIQTRMENPTKVPVINHLANGMISVQTAALGATVTAGGVVAASALANEETRKSVMDALRDKQWRAATDALGHGAEKVVEAIRDNPRTAGNLGKAALVVAGAAAAGFAAWKVFSARSEQVMEQYDTVMIGKETRKLADAQAVLLRAECAHTAGAERV